MNSQVHSLMSVFKGWDGYQTSLVQTIAPRSREQLIWRPTPHQRSAGEIARHISAGRVDWFYRTFGEESIAAARRVASWEEDNTIQEDSTELIAGLEVSWRMVEEALSRWTVADLDQTYPLTFQGTNYALPRQWILWRVMAHDLHHGGELAVTLGMQGVDLPELGDQGGHLTPPPLADPE